MPKKFLTERDIDALHGQGVTHLDVDDNTVLTALAQDRMQKLGIGIHRAAAQAAPDLAAQAAPDLAAQVKAAVLARVGDQVDAALLDAIIARVLTQT
jgi:hypothetical protein